MPWLGASLEDLNSLAVKLDQSAADIESSVSELAGYFVAVWWKGADADEFRNSWETTSSKQLTALAQECRNAATDVRRQRSAQEEASRANAAAAAKPVPAMASVPTIASVPTTSATPSSGPVQAGTPAVTTVDAAPADPGGV
jgi:peptidoglycan hydrolase CwlO-like protein